jgi:DnaK suppressor protein
MDDLTEERIAALEAALRALESELQAQLASTLEGTKPVDLDEPIGRLTRMDAIQQQSVSAANRRSLDLRLRQVRQALGQIARGDYGLCRRCAEPIEFRRLEARPESPYCLACQDAIDRKHS